MFTAFLALFLLAALLLAFWRPRPGLGLIAVGLALFWLGGNGVIASILLKPLLRSHTRLLAPGWGKHNAVILLAGGAFQPRGGAGPQPSFFAYSRITEAVRLYRDCVAAGKPCALIISGGDPAGLGVSEAAIYAGTAKELGVKESDLILETRSLNTFQNAEQTSRLIRAGGFDRTILVTSGIHMERSLLYFAHHGTPCTGSAADALQPVRTGFPVGLNLALIDLALHEHLGIIRYRVLARLGWPMAVADRGGAA